MELRRRGHRLPRAGVGVRTGAKGVIGTLTGSDPTTSHDADELVVTQLGRDAVGAGDEVVTLGSPNGRPYPPGITVGTVTDVERPPARSPTPPASTRPSS